MSARPTITIYAQPTRAEIIAWANSALRNSEIDQIDEALLEDFKDGLSALAAPSSAQGWQDTARDMLAAWDEPNRDIASMRLLVAASFAAQAYEDAEDLDAAPGNLLRALLVALVDPGSPELDHLRACNRPAPSQAQEG